jgi:hypothetical protein
MLKSALIASTLMIAIFAQGKDCSTSKPFHVFEDTKAFRNASARAEL